MELIEKRADRSIPSCHGRTETQFLSLSVIYHSRVKHNNVYKIVSPREQVMSKSFTNIS